MARSNFAQNSPEILTANDVPSNHFASLEPIYPIPGSPILEKECQFCEQKTLSGHNFCIRGDFKTKIRGSIDARKNINLVFADLCQYYLDHFEVWKSEFIKEMISDLYHIVGKLYDDLNEEDKPRFRVLKSFQNETTFYGTQFGTNAEGGIDFHYDKIQHCIAGMLLGAKYGYGFGTLVGWFIEKFDTMKAASLDLVKMKKPHQIGFDWYDYSWTVAGAALGHVLTYVDPEKLKFILYKFASGNETFDSFYQPPEFKEYKGIGKIDPLFPMKGNSADLLDRSINEMLEKLTRIK